MTTVSTLRIGFGDAWDSPPFASVLQDAANNSPSTTGITAYVSAAVAATNVAKRAFTTERPGNKIKFQRVLSGFLLEKLYPDDITLTILRRVRRFYPELAPLISAESLEFVRAFSLSLPVSVAQQFLRTWANGWTTSYRMNETQLLNCIFGCVGQPDCQQHYLHCPPKNGWLSIALLAVARPSAS